MKKQKGFILAVIAIAIAAAVATAIVVDVVETIQENKESKQEEQKQPSYSSGDTCQPIRDCPYPLKDCKLCFDGKCQSKSVCVRECPSPCPDNDFCAGLVNKVTVNKCVNGKCQAVTEQYDIFELADECSPVGSSCDVGCGFSECEISTIVNHVWSETGSSPVAGYAYACRKSAFAQSNECISSSDCEKKYGSGLSGGTTKFCSVTAIADPYPIIPEDQDQVKITAKNLINTKLQNCEILTGTDKCQLDKNINHCIFTQPYSSQDYKISCKGNSGYKDCNSYITIKKEGGVPPPPPPPEPEKDENGNGDYYAPKCSINKFELPNRVWTGTDIKAEWLTSAGCNQAEITCCKTEGEECDEKDKCENENLSGEVSVKFEESFKTFQIAEPGVYYYQLKACGDGENNCDTKGDDLGADRIEVQAINLPWWQEIIPVLPDKLQGFLRGLIS